MRILFISTVLNATSLEKPLGSLVQMNFGISYISSYLKDNGYDTELLVIGKDFGEKNYAILRKKIENYKPDIIGFYSVTTQYSFIREISGFIKSNYGDIFQIIGGPYPTLNPEKVIKDSFDSVCIGEGEIPMLKLVRMIEKGETPSGIENLWIKSENKIEKNLIAPFLQDLDSLSFPDRGLWIKHLERNIDISEHNLVVLLGRGCPFSCTYCCNHAFRKIAKGKYVRNRSPENIINEINHLHKKYPKIRCFYMEIESFNADKAWALRLCGELEKYNNTLDYPLSFGLNIRITPGADFDALFEASRKANVTYINIGIESGSERVRKEILNRNYSNKDILKTVDLARKHGLEYNFYVLIGVPGENYKDYRETIEICRICQPKIVAEHIYYPYPGTILYEKCKEMGVLPDKTDIGMERRQAIISLPGFSKRQIQKAYIWFNYNVYKGHRPRIKLLLRVISRYLNQYQFLKMVLLKISHSKLVAGIRVFLKRIRLK